MSGPSNHNVARPRRIPPLIVTATLAGAVLLVHGRSLSDGKFLDDHLHQQQVREASWNFHDLLFSSTIEPQQWLDIWWQHQSLRWDYSRPLAMAWMKAVQQASGDNTVWQHAGNVLWHFLCCVLVYCLALRITRRAGWSLFAAVLFAVYPHHVYTVGWLAAQNAVIQTTLSLAAVLCYLRASSLPVEEPTRIPPLHLGYFLPAVVLLSASLLCRETAVVLPVVLAGFDLAYGGSARLRARKAAHLLTFAIAAIFVFWRMGAFDSHIPEVYLRRPQGAEYFVWLGVKLLHYIVCVIWEAPMVVGPASPELILTRAPADLALMVGIVMVLGTGYLRACRGQVRGYWIWPVWIVLAVLPVLPILATPHSSYFAAVGFVIAVILKPASSSARRAPWSVGAAIWMMGSSLFATAVYRVCWEGVLAAEQYTIAQVTADSPPEEPVEVFLIDLPLANIYLPINLQEAWDQPGLEDRCHVLTFSPELLSGPRAGRIEQHDAYSFTLTSGERPYFDGLFGEFLTRALHVTPLQPGTNYDHEHFDVRLLEGNGPGIRRLRFRFRRPLNDPAYRFYAVTHECPGARVMFTAEGGSVELHCHDLPEAEAYRHRRERLFRVMRRTARIISTDLYLTGPPR